MCRIACLIHGQFGTQLMNKEICRFCGNELNHTFVDLGMSPPSNSYIKVEDYDKGQMSYPLHVHVCDKCFLVQLGWNMQKIMCKK